ncbi:ferritin-like fold-containing protein [Schaalia sp. Marseille-Q2122]|uniref:ferritin-like fold-containing protein n=1 Tax=Schaalia sp. Marseille-Q2122 TaxID=2736604 RepID=UPI00158D7637|nr:ferritin-like fold-containing protein [Schaalia sp. Marseille-Q2122]
MEKVYEPVDAGTRNVVGLIAYATLAAMTRLAKDGDGAPTISAHIEHAHMSARAYVVFSQLELWAVHRDVDLQEAAGQYKGLFDDLDARTRPDSWWERTVKTYVTIGILADFLQEVAKRRKLFSGAIGWDLGQNEWERGALAPLTAVDTQMQARLSLWARRVAGEVFGLVLLLLDKHPDLLAEPLDKPGIVEMLSARHCERMEQLHLQP